LTDGRFANLEFEDGDERRPPAPGETGHEAPRFVKEDRDAAHYLEKALAEDLAGDHEKALRSYSAALGENPLLIDAWVGQLRMLLDLDELPETRLWADKALEKFPDNPSLLAMKSVALFRMGNQREARELNDAALARKGETPAVWLCRGEIMLGEERAAADECFQRAIGLAAQKDIARMRAGALYHRYGKYGKALSMLQDAAAGLPTSARLWYLTGLAQEALGMDTQARTSYREALGLNPLNEVYRTAVRRPRKSFVQAVMGFIGKVIGR